MTTPRPVPPEARVRVIIDNDFSGDPDDLYQLAHHVLLPSTHVAFVIGSHLRAGDFFDPSDRQAENAVHVARDLLRLLGIDLPVVQGSNVALESPDAPIDTPAVRAIIAEALRDDTDTPLFFIGGGGLTEIASALLIEPAIADRITVAWLGGPEYPGAPVPPGIGPSDYNLRIDIPAARSVFAGTVALWQIPRESYRRALISRAELETRVRPCGALGARLVDAIDDLEARAQAAGMPMGDTYNLADSALVLITSLWSAFEPDASSSEWVERPAPSITEDGEYGPPAADARTIRVFGRLDTRLLFEDMFARFALWAERARTASP